MTRIHQFAACNDVIFWRIDPYLTLDEAGTTFLSEEFSPVPMEWSYWSSPNHLMHLTLEGTVDDVFKKMDSTARNEIRRATRDGIIVTIGGTNEIDVFFDLIKLDVQVFNS